MEPKAVRDEAPLLERERELDAVREALRRLAAGQGSLLLIEGPAGIGKTRLLAAAAELASPGSVRMLAARAGQLERAMPFVVARQLFETLIAGADEAERARLLSGSAALALTAIGDAGPGGSAAEVDRFAPIQGLYWLVANLCDAEPALIVIDDAHWADGESLRWLDFLARRVTDTPTLILVGARSGEPDEPAELESLRIDATEVLRPSPLSGAATGQLIAANLGSPPSADLSAACSKATGGNPFLLTEVLRTLRMSSTGPDPNDASQLRSLGPESVARSVRTRLQPFGADAASLAHAIAVLGGAPQLRHASQLAGISEEQARDLCDRLRDAEILAPGHPIDFVHPLVRTALYQELTEEQRSDAHRQAAELISATGSGPRDVAPHLMASAPNGDRWVADQLRDAAREAMKAGAPDAARRYLERTLEEAAGEELAVSYEFGRAVWGTSPIDASELFVSIAERAEEPELRLRAVEDAPLTFFDCGNLERVVHWLSELVPLIPADQVEERLRVEASLFCVKTMHGGCDPDDSARIGAVAAGSAGGTPGERMIRQALSFDRFMAGAPVAEVIDLARTFPPAPWIDWGPAPGVGLKVLAWSGEWRMAREAATRGFEGSEVSGILHIASYREAFLAEIDRQAGRLADSEAEARTGLDIVKDLAPASMPALIGNTNLLATLIARGKLEEAAELAAPWGDLSAPFSVVPTVPSLLEIRGTLRLARGELAGGVEDMLTVGDDLEELGFLNPALAPWRQEAVSALAALDRSGEARRIVVEGERRADAFGAGHVIGTMLRARASIESKRKSMLTLKASIEVLEASGPPHELARSLLELGSAMRRNGDRSESREPLRKALELAHVSGADGLADRARGELAAAGSRPRNVFRTGVNSLTASELRAAKLAADGLSNLEIAQRLFVTRKTVEKHLGNAYAKLEISSRTELPASLEAASPVGH